MIYAFIDSQNVNISIRAQGWQLDFEKFRHYLQYKYNVSSAFLFIGYIAGKDAFYARLRSYGYVVILKPTIYLPDGKIKGNLDAELVLHAMIEYPNYDQAIIVSNDGDFYCLIEYLEKKNKFLKLLIPNRFSYSFLLRVFSKKIHFLNDLKQKLEKK